MTNRERTLVVLMPEALEDQLVDQILERINSCSDMAITARRQLTFERALAEEFYHDFKGMRYYGALVASIMRGPVIILIVEGDDVISRMRELVGATNPANAEPGSIRGDLAKDIDRNLVYCSPDYPGYAEREITLVFGFSYSKFYCN
jgi:nucleoside-diphosphate kinase